MSTPDSTTLVEDATVAERDRQEKRSAFAPLFTGPGLAIVVGLSIRFRWLLTAVGEPRAQSTSR